MAAVRKKAEIGKGCCSGSQGSEGGGAGRPGEDPHKIAAFGPDANVVGESVIEAMRDKVGAVQTAAAEALAKINPGGLSPHRHHSHPPRNRKARSDRSSLGELGAKARIAVPFLIYCNDNSLLLGRWELRRRGSSTRTCSPRSRRSPRRTS